MCDREIKKVKNRTEEKRKGNKRAEGVEEMDGKKK